MRENILSDICENSELFQYESMSLSNFNINTGCSYQCRGFWSLNQSIVGIFNYNGKLCTKWNYVQLS